jgi:hypothetical protein
MDDDTAKPERADLGEPAADSNAAPQAPLEPVEALRPGPAPAAEALALNDVVEDAETLAPSRYENDAPALITDSTPIGVQPVSFERTQRNLAYMLLSVLIGIIVVIVLLSVIYSYSCWAHPLVAEKGAPPVDPCAAVGPALTLFNQSISPVFTAMIGLVGSVVGFYFGSKKS